MSQRKEKFGVSLPAETVKLMDENLLRLGLSSRAKLVDAAVNEYISLHILKQFPDELSEIYGAIEARGIKAMEDRMAGLLYKIAIEIAQMNLLLYDEMGLNDDDFYNLRRDAAKMVNHNGGIVHLKTIAKNKYR